MGLQLTSSLRAAGLTAHVVARAAERVPLNDTGTEQGRDEQIPMALFMQSWNTGNQLVVVTT